MMNLRYIHFDNFLKVSKNHKSLKIVKISTFWLHQFAALHTTHEAIKILNHILEA